MEDIALVLLKKIQQDFQNGFDKSSLIQGLYAKVRDGTATYQEANEFAVEAGDILVKAYRNNISSDILPDGKLYYNIAQRILNPTLKNNYELITDVTEQVQKSLNDNANIGIKPVKPKLNQDRIDGIINRASNVDNYDDVSWILDEPVKNFSQSIVDDSIRANAEFHAKAGMSPKIVRKLYGGCCDWCKALAGTYSYPDVPKDVYRRHQRCRCIVDYYPGNGKVQNVHSKQWHTQEERDKIEARKIAGLIAEDDAVMRDIRDKIIPKQNISKVADRQRIHRVGSELYEVRKNDLLSRGEYGPSYLTITDEKILELVRKYSGKGKIKYNRRGEWTSQETILTNEEIIGVVVDNRNGNSAETSVFKIHYAKDGIHIVPDYPSKRR